VTTIKPSPPGVTPKVCSGCGREGEWPGQPCPLCKDGAVPLNADSRNTFDPIGLHELAVHLRDQRWLDMHVDDERGKLVKRCRLTSIIVRTTDELVSARQEWVDGTDDEPQFNHQDLVFDAEAIWRVTSPTLFDIEGLTPYGMDAMRVAIKPPNLTGEPLRIMRAIVAAVSKATGHSAAEIVKRGHKEHHDLTHSRYMAMLMLYDMTQLDTQSVTEAFGYLSQMPMQSARWRINRTDADGNLEPLAQGTRKRILEIAGRVDKALGGAKRREPVEHRYVL
jgi:hypothetical protein